MSLFLSAICCRLPSPGSVSILLLHFNYTLRTHFTPFILFYWVICLLSCKYCTVLRVVKNENHPEFLRILIEHLLFTASILFHRAPVKLVYKIPKNIFIHLSHFDVSISFQGYTQILTYKQLFSVCVSFFSSLCLPPPLPLTKFLCVTALEFTLQACLDSLCFFILKYIL